MDTRDVTQLCLTYTPGSMLGLGKVVGSIQLISVVKEAHTYMNMSKIYMYKLTCWMSVLS